jgi:citrate lyase subunit beta/citryl-CoA lyase
MPSVPARSYLYVPGSESRKMEKALATDADAVVFDLEDAVAANRKEFARDQVARALRAGLAKPIVVRVNAVGSGLVEADLAAIAGPWLAAVRLPKVESPDEVRHVADLLARAGCAAGIQCLLESALGVEYAFAIAQAHERVKSLGLGEADLRADLGVEDDAGLAYARSRVVVAARAAGLPGPTQSVYTAIGDLDGLRRSTEEGRRMGFSGRSVIHPGQIAVVNEVFTPSEEEIRRAHDLIDRLHAAAAIGTGAFALEDGRFVDRAVVEAARRTLALAHAVRREIGERSHGARGDAPGGN